MNIRPVLIAALASASLASPFVMAHTGGHDDNATPRRRSQTRRNLLRNAARPTAATDCLGRSRDSQVAATACDAHSWELFVYGVETSKILSRRGGGASLR